jgi:Zn-dependent protease/predicted transcriptional regulator
MTGFRVGRLFGINIHVDWSWLLIFGLVSWSMSATFGQIHSGWAVGMRWGLAMLAALLFFASVLAHELAHSLAALARGVPVQNITLFMFGGVANIQREPATPAEDIFITIVGPLTSLFLGALFLVIGAGGYVTSVVSLSPASLLARLQPLNTILAWLGSINIMVGFFNLIPAFPLDGGRIVRALIWAVSNNLRNATRLAVLMGQGIGWLMIVSGTVMMFGVQVPFFGTGIFNGIWLVFLGLFLRNAAAAGYKHVLVQEMLVDVPVGKVMQNQIPVISSDVLLDELIHRQLGKAEETLLVAEGQDVVGMVAIHDVSKSSKDEWDSTPVSEIMTLVSDLEYVTPDQNVAEAFDRLQRRKLCQIPVIRDQEIVGLLRRKDIIRWLQFQSELKS